MKNREEKIRAKIREEVEIEMRQRIETEISKYKKDKKDIVPIKNKKDMNKVMNKVMNKDMNKDMNKVMNKVTTDKNPKMTQFIATKK